MAVHASGIDVTTVTTTRQFPLGQTLERYNPTTGAMELWIYVQANGTIVVGSVCARGTGAAVVTNDVVLAPTNSNSFIVVGVAQHAIANNSFGFIMREGVGEVLAGTAAITIDEGLLVDSTVPGTAMDWAADPLDAGDMPLIFGWASETVAATALATCRIKCLG